LILALKIREEHGHQTKDVITVDAALLEHAESGSHFAERFKTALEPDCGDFVLTAVAEALHVQFDVFINSLKQLVTHEVGTNFFVLSDGHQCIQTFFPDFLLVVFCPAAEDEKEVAVNQAVSEDCEAVVTFEQV